MVKPVQAQGSDRPGTVGVTQEVHLHSKVSPGEPLDPESLGKSGGRRRIDSCTPLWTEIGEIEGLQKSIEARAKARWWEGLEDWGC